MGAGFSELQYCYEKDLKVLPSSSIVTLYDFMALVADASKVNLAGILHAEQEILFHHPIPAEGTLTTEGAITRYYDRGKEKGAFIVGEFETLNINGEKLYTSIATVLGRLDGGFGGKTRPRRKPVFRRGRRMRKLPTPLPRISLFFSASQEIFFRFTWMPSSPAWPASTSRSCTAFAPMGLRAGP